MPRTKLSEVDDAPAALEQQQLVESLEDVDGRLVDGAHDRAAGVDRVADRPHDDGGRTCVQAYGQQS